MSQNHGNADGRKGEFFREMSTLGDPIPCNVKTTNVDNAKPGDVELRAVVVEIHNERTGEAVGLEVERINGWLSGAIAKEEEDMKEGTGELWCVFIELVQTTWETGIIPL